MTFAGPERVIDLDAVPAGDERPGAPRRTDRRAVRRVAVALLGVLCAVTLTGSSVPRSHAARVLWSIPYNGQAFTLSADSLYLQARAGGRRLEAYDLADGSLRWARPLAGPSSIRISPTGDVLLPVNGTAAGPGTARRTVALDAATGAERWRITGEIAALRGDRAVVVDWDRGGALAALAVVRLSDGRTVWARPAEARVQWSADDEHLLAR